MLITMIHHPLPRRVRSLGPLLLTLAAALLLLPGPSPAAAQPATIDLRPVWTKGQMSEYRVSQTELSVAQVPMADQSIENSTQVDADVRWEIIDASPAGGGRAKMTITSIEMAITDNEGNVTRISDRGGDEGTEPFQQWAKAVAGSPLTITVDASGNVTDVGGYQAIQSKAGDAGKNLDADYFKEIAMDLALLAGGPSDAKPGSTWRRKHDAKHRMGRIAYDGAYELEGIEDVAGIPLGMISFESKMDFTPDLSELPADGPQITVKTDEASQRGQILFDVSRGEVVGTNVEQTLAVTMSISFQGRQIVRNLREVTSTQIIRTSEK
jgi:hypothetical protein